MVSLVSPPIPSVFEEGEVPAAALRAAEPRLPRPVEGGKGGGGKGRERGGKGGGERGGKWNEGEGGGGKRGKRNEEEGRE